jgi:hypothetical protein
MAQVSSVSVANSGISGVVQVVAGVQVVSFSTNQVEAPALAEAINEQRL